MNKILFVLSALALLVLPAHGHLAWAGGEPGYYSASDQPEQSLFTPEELDDLLAPIALYPDPLIAQMLPAATFVDQIDEAARYLTQYTSLARIGDQPWDVSVKAVAHYPDLLFMMDQKYDWTVALGQAYLNQPQDVMVSIQALRADALDQGNLVSTPQQEVIDAPGDIRIVPAAADYLNLPVYDPQQVYYEPGGPSYSFITFGAGLAIGAWLNRDMNWRDHQIFYTGWRGSGWVSRSRPHIKDRRGIYINQHAATIATNRQVLQHDIRTYRQQLQHLDVPGRQAAPGRPGGTPAPPVAAVQPPSRRAAQDRPNSSDLFRGRDVQQAQPASRTGYGGYGSAKDAATYRERGQSSRATMRLTDEPAQTAPYRSSPPSQRGASAPAAVPRSQVPRPQAPVRERQK